MEREERYNRLIRWLVRRPLSYRMLGAVGDLAGIRNDNIPYKIWVRFLLHSTREAYSRRRPVVWMSAFAPAEIAYGLGAVPFMPEIIAALVAYLGQGRRPLALADSQLSTDVCSFYRLALGLVMDDYLPAPDLVLSSSHLCDGANKFFRNLAERTRCPHLLLDPPYDADDGARRYLVAQLEETVEQSAWILGVPLDEGLFSKALQRSNQARAYMVRINRLRQKSPAPLSGSEALSYLAGMNFYSPGSGWGVDFYRSLYRYLEGRVARGEGPVPDERFRLLWLHHIRPYYKNDIFEVLAAHHAVVAFEEPNYLYWPELNIHKPMEGLAEKVLTSIWAGPLERRLAAVEEMVDAYGIDGVIHFSHWGCRQSCGGAGIIGDRLKERGLPYIILPGDGADADNYSPGQTRTRLEALMEMLENARGSHSPGLEQSAGADRVAAPAVGSG